MNEYYSLLDFAQLWMQEQKNEEYTVLPFHRKLSNALERIITADNPRNIIICMPPRFGKSELAIKIFIPYVWSMLPDCNFIVASATLSLARDHTNNIKKTLQSEWYQELFPWGAKLQTTNEYNKIVKTAQRADYIDTIQGGSLKAIGLGGQITGFGSGKKRKENIFGGCIICDDLLPEQDFNSTVQRQTVYEWFKSTICSRVNDNRTPIILIMQRLHVDDIVGRLLDEQPQKWDLIEIRAFDEIEQKSVWENAISTEKLLDLKNSTAPIDQYMFFAKYQQSPKLDLNATIKTEWWKYYDQIEDIYDNIFSRIITLDTAYKTKTYNDESVIQLWGFSSENAYLMDMIHGRWEFIELLNKTRSFYEKHNFFIKNKLIDNIYIEDKASGISLAQTLRREKLPVINWLPQPGEPKDKMSRVLESSKYIARGKVFLNKNATYIHDFINQCAQFTGENDVHDDMVDAMTMAIMLWRQYGANQ